MPPRRPFLLAASLVALATGVLLLAGTKETAAAPNHCRVGGVPTHDYGERPPESFLRYATRPVVIGCPVLRSGRRLELVGYQLGRTDDTALCIDHYDVDSRLTWGCGTNSVVGGGPVDATEKTILPQRPDVVAGTVSASVATVVVRFEIGGRLHRHPAVVVAVRSPRLLRAIAVAKP